MSKGSRCIVAALVIAFATLAISLSRAAADAYSWAEATTETGRFALADGTEVAYRAGSILLGDRFEVAVTVEWNAADAPIEQEIVREMADSPPKVSVRGDLVEISWTVFPIGTDTKKDVKGCWRLAANRLAFEKRQCGCSP